jgi:DNA topoisomerase-1
MSKSYTKKIQKDNLQKNQGIKLVIVESPAKTKKIESFLGQDYKCIASYGHLRELKILSNISQENIEPVYSIIDEPKKKAHIEFLYREIKSAGEVILATDDDREGEAIAWHICILFDLPVSSTKRIVFNEITERSILDAVKNPRTINMNMVNSQKARQVLDLSVGFQISPLLWKYISRNLSKKSNENALSAGRCQTPALLLIYDRQKEIDSVKNKKVYNTQGYFTSLNIPFELNKNFENREDVIRFLEESKNFSHIYTFTQPTKIYKKPPEPLITSSIQQLASNHLHFSPKLTMKLCQQLYEEGYITYMRTDNKKYCNEFICTVKSFIEKTYEDKYINPNLYELQTKTNTDTGTKTETKTDTKTNVLTQEAHEAIRPTSITLSEYPETQEKVSQIGRLYKLIWETTMESCMAPAEGYSITASINAPSWGRNMQPLEKKDVNAKVITSNWCEMEDPLLVKYIYNSQIINFLGWQVIKNREKKLEKEEKNYVFLLQLKQNSILPFKKIISTMKITDIKQHYSEAKLVSLLEEKGIGRPSTFSMLVDKIQERKYVKKEDVKGKEIECIDFELENSNITQKITTREFGNEKNKLIIQPLGIIVCDFLKKHFQELFDYEYTKNMENELDKICNGEKEWKQLCIDCNKQIMVLSETLKEEKKFEIKIDDNHFYVVTKNGPALKCIQQKEPNDFSLSNQTEKITYKSVKSNLDLEKLKRGEYKLCDIVDNTTKQMGIYKNECVFLKKGKYGLYISWGPNNISLSAFGNRPIDNITYEEILPFLENIQNTQNTQNTQYENETKVIGVQEPSGGPISGKIIREINKYMSIRNSKYGDYIYYKTDKMKKPKFFKLDGFVTHKDATKTTTSYQETDYKVCNIDTLKDWIKDKYNI